MIHASRLSLGSCAFLVALACASGCKGKTAPAAAFAPLDTTNIAHNPNLPIECKIYAEGMKRCMASPQFPPELLGPEKLAVEQMMESSTVDATADASRSDAWRAVAQNCQDSINTMQESGKLTCPGVFTRAKD
jgi:hypothetical protein